MKSVTVTLYWMRITDLNEVLGSGIKSELAWVEAKARKVVKSLRPRARVVIERDTTVDVPGRWDAGRFVKIEDRTDGERLFNLSLFERLVEDTIISYIRMRSTRV